MKRRNWVLLLLGIWAALYVASFLVPYFTPPTDFGFTRGMNRMTLFFRYQIGAGAVAAVLWWMGRHAPKRRNRWLMRVPALLALGLVLFIVGLIAFARLDRPLRDSAPPAAPSVTAPIR
jgi:NhaP-type Na+/H+ or K+/H+ antiporter